MLVERGEVDASYQALAPVLAERTPFTHLDRIGAAIGEGPGEEVRRLLDRVASGRTIGGWPVIGSALGRRAVEDLEGSLSLVRGYIIGGDIWHAADSLGERVPGQCLVIRFEETLELLDPWRRDENRWVRRAVGTAVHFWTKRSKGERPEEAGRLLEFLSPMFEEREMDAVKGVGWGFKTLGKYYPQLMAAWLPGQMARPHRALMLRKALTYLTPEQRTQVTIP